MATTKGKFQPLAYYNRGLEAGYQLLPFRFIQLDDSRYVLTNVAGEYTVVQREELNAFVHKQLEPNTALFNTLKAKHFLMDSSGSVALDLLALKVRTKMQPVANFTSLHMFVTTLRCDHSCPYCQVSRQSEDRAAFDMSPEIADKAIDFTFQSPNPAIKITPLN